MAPQILLVDDDKGVQFFHQVVVSQSKVSVLPLSFDNGSNVFNYLNQHCDETDNYLVLLDINMPLMNGWDFLEAIISKNYYKRVHIVMVSSSVDNADREKAKRYEQVIGFVEKPVSEEEFERILDLPDIAPYFNN